MILIIFYYIKLTFLYRFYFFFFRLKLLIILSFISLTLKSKGLKKINLTPALPLSFFIFSPSTQISLFTTITSIIFLLFLYYPTSKNELYLSALKLIIDNINFLAYLYSTLHIKYSTFTSFKTLVKFIIYTVILFILIIFINYHQLYSALLFLSIIFLLSSINTLINIYLIIFSFKNNRPV